MLARIWKQLELSSFAGESVKRSKYYEERSGCFFNSCTYTSPMIQPLYLYVSTQETWNYVSTETCTQMFIAAL